MEGRFEQLKDDVRMVQVYMYVYIYPGHMYMNIIRIFDGWMGG